MAATTAVEPLVNAHIWATQGKLVNPTHCLMPSTTTMNCCHISAVNPTTTSAPSTPLSTPLPCQHCQHHHQHHCHVSTVNTSAMSVPSTRPPRQHHCHDLHVDNAQGPPPPLPRVVHTATSSTMQRTWVPGSRTDMRRGGEQLRDEHEHEDGDNDTLSSSSPQVLNCDKRGGGFTTSFHPPSSSLFVWH
jgi:hypothetical protein